MSNVATELTNGGKVGSAVSALSGHAAVEHWSEMNALEVDHYEKRIAELEAECAVLREALLCDVTSTGAHEWRHGDNAREKAWCCRCSVDAAELVDDAVRALNSTDAGQRAAAVIAAAREWAKTRATIARGGYVAQQMLALPELADAISDAVDALDAGER